jgi:hypothetical protein
LENPRPVFLLALTVYYEFRPRATHTHLQGGTIKTGILSLLARAMLLLIAVSPTAWSHAGSQSQLALRIEGRELRGELIASLVDVALALRLPPEQPAALLQQQIDARQPQWHDYVQKGLVAFLNGQPVRLETGGIRYATRDGESVLQLSFRTIAPSRIDSLDVLYTLFYEDDALHTGLASVRWPDGRVANGVFRLAEPLVHFESDGDRGTEFRQFLWSGAWHVWSGYDHVLFLLALLLPSVLRGAPGAWAPAPALRPALLRVAAIVTAFTLAHTLTLGLAAAWRIELPPRIVEPAIAVSVFIASACNLLPRIAFLAGTRMAFGFGLIHGMAFGQVLGELITDRREILRPLLAFNLGVEIAQLAIVAVFLPLAWQLRGTVVYRRVLLGGGSAVLCACAAAWFVARLL